MHQLSPMKRYKNVAYYGDITGDGDPRSLTYAVQYVNDVRNTNLVAKIEIRGEEVFADGSKVALEMD
jgi:hypothetical protein